MLTLPEEIVAAIRATGPDTNGFVLDAIQRELARRRQVDALHQAAGLWSHYENLPETREGIVVFVRQLRQNVECLAHSNPS